MCSNDVTAIGVLQKAYRAGLRVPDDLSVIGFDNIHLTQMTTPPLTTIQMSCFELARAAVWRSSRRSRGRRRRSATIHRD